MIAIGDEVKNIISGVHVLKDGTWYYAFADYEKQIFFGYDLHGRRNMGRAFQLAFNSDEIKQAKRIEVDVTYLVRRVDK